MRSVRGEDESLPPYLRPPKFGKLVFDPSLRTAAELVSMSIAPIAEPMSDRNRGAQNHRQFAEAS